MKALISVLVVEPSEIILEGLRSILEQSGKFNFLAPMHDATNLVERLPIIRPDVLIINPTILSSTPKQQLVSIAQTRSSMAVIALLYQYVESVLMDNFRFVIDIRASRGSIVASINNALKALSDEPESFDQTENYELSDRETDVLVLVAKGLSSKEIASRLHISIHTVNSHRKNITHKTGIKSVAGLAVYAMIHNLMDDYDNK